VAGDLTPPPRPGAGADPRPGDGARDLIPPPSPAGRPAPDPEPPPPPAERVTEAAAGPEPAPLGPSPFRARFGFLTGVLAGCALAAGLVFAVLLTTAHDREDGLAPNWSAWQPATAEPLAGAAEIAAHVGRAYRDARRKQLVSVRGGPIALGNLPLAVAVRQAGGSVEVLEGPGVQYTLNGLGPSGTIKDGKPSVARHRLLRREALELALYSFRYLDDVSMVVALLPPAAPAAKPAAKGTKREKALQRQALFYRAAELRPQLEVPLHVTMAPRAPAPGALRGAEARRIDSLTLSNLFLYSHAQAQDARTYLVLDRAS
jgi:hypothetical protein